jgi:hypothetical protein
VKFIPWKFDHQGKVLQLQLAFSSFVYFLLPETKNVPIEQMNRVWSEHWFLKRIVEEVNDDIKVEAP